MKKTLSFVLVFLLLVPFTSCTALTKLLKKEAPPPVEEVLPVDPNFPVTIGDVDVPDAPQRVVCLSPSLVEQLYDLGLEDSLVGVSEFTPYPPEAATLPPVGTALLPDLDEISALGTDLILSPTPLLAVDEDALEKEGIPLLVLPPPQDLDSLWATYETIALALKGTEEGGALGKEFTTGLTGWFQVFTTETKGQEPLSVAYIHRLPFIFATGDTFEGRLLTHMGLTNIAEQDTDWIYPEEKAQGEGLKDFQALDYLFFNEEELTITDFEKSGFYAGLPATLEDRYIVLDGPALEGRGVRMFRELLSLAEKAWPDSTFTPLSFDFTPASTPTPTPTPAPPQTTPPREKSGSLEPDSRQVEAFTE